MFARTMFRAAQPCVRQQFRRYATEGPAKTTPSSSSSSSKNSGSNNTLLYGGGAAAVLGALGYYFFSGTSAGQTAAAKAHDALPGAVKKAFTGGDQGWLSLKLESVETVNHNTKRFRFALPEADQVSGMPVASALLAKFMPEGKDKPVLRPYTPISDEDTPGHIDLLVKRYDNGPMSTHLHDMAPGQRLDLKGPLPKYAWTPNKHEHVGLVAGGTGITPMFQLLRAILTNPADQTKVTLVFANVSEEDILLRRELADLENSFPRRFRAFYVLDKAPKGWAGQTGYITRELLKTVLPEPKEGDAVKVFVCGPPAMMNAISGNKKSPKDQGELTGALKELGYKPEQVYKF